MYCRKCGNDLDDDDVFCSRCGSQVKNQNQQSIIPLGEHPKKHQGFSKNRIARILAVSVSFILIIYMAISFRSDESKLVGTWACENSVYGYPDGIVLYENGVAIADGYDCTWYIEDGIIFFEDISIFVSNQSYRYEVVGSKLYLDGFVYTKND